jgi:hypothetical protein
LSAGFKSSLCSSGDSPQVFALLKLTPELVLPLGSVVVELEVHLKGSKILVNFNSGRLRTKPKLKINKMFRGF